MIKPKKLNKGDKVAIISLSRGILGENFCKHQIELGLKRLNELELTAVFMPNSLKGIDFIKNNPESRAQDLKDAYKDPSIKGIICAIGGDDTYRTIPYLLDDTEFIENVRKNPKVFIGFSDATNNHFMFYKLGIVTYYGLNFLSDLAELSVDMLPYTKASYERLLKNEESFNIESSPIWYKNRDDFSVKALGTNCIEYLEKRGYEVLRGNGIISGKLLGGCLESIYDMYTGNRYQDQKILYEEYKIIPQADEWKDKVLFIETCEEKPNPIIFKKMMQTLIDNNVLQSIKAMIIGKPYDEEYYEEYKMILIELTQSLELPILYNVNFGHALPRAVIPYGVEAQIDFDNKEIKIIEKIFST